MGRLTALLFCCAIASFAQTISDYTHGQWIVLDNGVNQIQLNDGAVKTYLGVPPVASVSGADRVAVRFWLQFAPGAGTSAPCGNPCVIDLPRSGGDASYEWQHRSGTTALYTSPVMTLKAAAETQSGTVTMPIELVGFAGRQGGFKFTPVGNVSGPLRLYLQIHGLTYPGKASVRVNGGAWISLIESNVTRIDWCGETGGWGGFGGFCQTQEFTMPLADGVIHSGTNYLDFRFNVSAWNSSGARVLRANILRPASTITQAVLSGSSTLATLTQNGHGYTVGQSVWIRGVRRGGFRINGWRTVTSVPNANTFTVVPGNNGFDGTQTNINMTSSAALIPLSAFVEENPLLWTAPSTAPADIAAGEALWRATNSLLDPERYDLTAGPITASCSDCHAQDGRDLQYFNFSNKSIIARSIYHGLTRRQGELIASYIRSLNVPRPARPWTPVYQPGPGLDAKPATEWAAGAGLEWALGEDIDMVPYLSNPATFAHNANPGLNPRETPWPYAFPDWNAWLPKVHPKDALPATWTDNPCNTEYTALRSGLSYRNVTAYTGSRETWSQWKDHCMNSMRHPLNNNPANLNENQQVWERSKANRVYSIGLWSIVKHWEMMQEYELEDFGKGPFPGNLYSRSWTHNAAFMASPNQSKLSKDDAGAFAGVQPNTHNQYSNSWYVLAFILNCCSGGPATGVNPIDWGYAYGFIKSAGTPEGEGDDPLIANGGPGQWAAAVLYASKALQAFEANAPGNSPAHGESGWEPNTAIRPSFLVSHSILLGTYASPYWTAAERTLLLQNHLQAYANKVTTFTPQEFYDGDWATASQTPLNMDCGSGDAHAFMICKVFYALPRYKHLGVSSALINNLVDYFKTIWPLHPTVWDRIKTSTCTESFLPSAFSCTSDNKNP